MRKEAILLILNCLLLFPPTGFGQTRTEELEEQRSEHQKQLAPEKNTTAEQFLVRFKDDKILERISYGYNGLRAKVGGLVTGGGFALGPEYFREDLRGGSVVVRAGAQISFKNYEKGEAQLTLPKLLGGKVFLDTHATHRNYPGINYYGPGPDSSKDGRANYRLEDTAFDAALGVSPVRSIKLGGAVGFLAVNVGPGTDERFASAEEIYSPAQAPGIDRQTNFLRYGAFGQFDFRDNPLGPKHGGNYVVQYTRFEDRDLGSHDFNLLDVDLQHYIGFFNRTRVIALRAHTRLTDSRADQTVPFYLQPVLGGSDDLRGFRPFRFSGNNSLLLSAEYRWEIFSGCDGALFVDGGKVFRRRGELNLRNLESSVGFGLRFNARNRPFTRLDVAFSHEGFQVWFKFNDIFQQRPLGTSDSQPIW
jgi:outer membrane protein assembly factor BamA